MRKYLIIAAVAAMGALMSSCQSEKDIETPASQSGEVSLVLGGIATRAEAEGILTSVKNYEYDLGVAASGEHYTLEETVMDMGTLVEDAPETRGTPAYTENVTSVYGNSFNGVIYGASSQIVGDGAFEIYPLSGKNCWRREIGYDPWERAGGDVTFFLRMPATQAGVSGLTYDYSAGSIAFDYTSPETAAEQQDILFASRNISKETYVQEYKDGGASVLFRHALTGVKFAIGNNKPGETMQTYITKVVITGLKDSGHAVYVPAGTETNSDNNKEFSSASSFTWTPGTTTGTFTQEYAKEDIVDFAAGDAVGAPESFYKGGADRNLNKADASLTFWFVPQQITNALKMVVTLYVHDNAKNQDGEEVTLELEMGKLILAQASGVNAEWKAGQLRTFTLKPDTVDITIEDEVHGFVKDNIVIRNTGNVDAYIRAMIVANWWGTVQTATGTDTGIATGYTSEAHTDFVDIWKREGTTGDNYGGVFTGLPGDNWVLAQDGYFYYKNKVAPGAETGDKFFDNYTLDTTANPVPEIWYIDGSVKQYQNVFLRMEIPVQAIEAKEGVNWDDAWAGALGDAKKPVPQQ